MSEHDQLVILKEQIRVFRKRLVSAIDLSVGGYRITREQILKWFDECFVDEKMEAKP